MTTDAAEAMQAFADAVTESKIGPDIRFSDRIEISAMDLMAAVLGELELHDFGDADRREHMAEWIVRRVHRDATQDAPWPSRPLAG